MRRAVTTLAGMTVAATMLVAGCGDDGDSEDAASDEGAGGGAFCEQWAAVETEQQSIPTRADGMAAMPDYFAAISSLVDELDPPDELADAVDTLRTTYSEVIVAAEGFDWEGFQTQMEEAERAAEQGGNTEAMEQISSEMSETFAPLESQEFIEANDQVSQYVIDNCSTGTESAAGAQE